MGDASTSGTQSFQSGYATLDCKATKVEAQLLYSYYSPDGTKLSEATVFSSPSGSSVRVLAINVRALNWDLRSQTIRIKASTTP